MNQQVIDHLVGHGLQRPGPVAGVPPLPVLAQHLGPTHPLVECPVDGNVHVGGDQPLGLGHHEVALSRRTNEQASHQFGFGPSGGCCSISDSGGHRDGVVNRQPVHYRPIGLAPSQAEHPFPQSSHHDGWCPIRHGPRSIGQPEPGHVEALVGPGDLLSAECLAQEPHGVANPGVRRLEPDAIPAFDDHVGRRA